MSRWIAVLLAVTVTASPAVGENRTTAEPVVTVIAPNSLGMPSCGAWTAARAYQSDGIAAQYEKWVFGFQSGLNWAQSATRGDVVRDTDADAILGWVDQHCREHPLDPVLRAVVNLDRELARRRTVQ